VEEGVGERRAAAALLQLPCLAWCAVAAADCLRWWLLPPVSALVPLQSTLRRLAWWVALPKECRSVAKMAREMTTGLMTRRGRAFPVVTPPPLQSPRED